MEELSVIVTQEPGSVSWNFEEIKAALAVRLDEYTQTIYTDETIGTAKTDVAMLRKLSSSVEERRKEIKNKCLEPYEIIEKQAKELVQLINQPIEAINAQVKDYEARRVAIAQEQIQQYWDSKVDVLPEGIRQKAWDKIYDSRWTNATATKKSWKDGIDNGISSIVKDLETISSFNSEFEEDAKKVYFQTLDLASAIQKMNQLNEMKKAVEEKQRQKELEEQRRQEEFRKAEEAKAVQATASEEIDMQKAIAPAPAPVAEQPTVAVPPVQPVHTEEEKQDIMKFTQLKIIGTVAQIDKIKSFIKYTGADFTEVI